jgi:hypothetical protein
MCGKKQSRPDLRYYASKCLSERRKTTTIITVMLVGFLVLIGTWGITDADHKGYPLYRDIS